MGGTHPTGAATYWTRQPWRKFWRREEAEDHLLTILNAASMAKARLQAVAQRRGGCVPPLPSTRRLRGDRSFTSRLEDAKQVAWLASVSMIVYAVRGEVLRIYNIAFRKHRLVGYLHGDECLYTYRRSLFDEMSQKQRAASRRSFETMLSARGTSTHECHSRPS